MPCAIISMGRSSSKVALANRTCDQWHQQAHPAERASFQPSRTVCSGQVEPFAAECMALKIEEKMVGILADQYMGKEPRTGAAALDGARGVLVWTNPRTTGAVQPGLEPGSAARKWHVPGGTIAAGISGGSRSDLNTMVPLTVQQRATWESEAPGTAVWTQIDRFTLSVQSRCVLRIPICPGVSKFLGGHRPSLPSRGSEVTPDACQSLDESNV